MNQLYLLKQNVMVKLNCSRGFEVLLILKDIFWLSSVRGYNKASSDMQEKVWGRLKTRPLH